MLAHRLVLLLPVDRHHILAVGTAMLTPNLYFHETISIHNLDLHRALGLVVLLVLETLAEALETRLSLKLALLAIVASKVARWIA